MMFYFLPKDRMPEAEVSLRLAFHILSLSGSDGFAAVAIDGAQVRLGRREIFPIYEFLDTQGWRQTKREGKNQWQGKYERAGSQLKIHARSGVGDVLGRVGAIQIRAECKGGPLVKKRGSPEYPILREALGQLLTLERVGLHDLLVVAVPHTTAFHKLVDKWRRAPLVVNTKIRLVLVSRSGDVRGLESAP